MHFGCAKKLLMLGLCLPLLGTGCATMKSRKWYDPLGIFIKEDLDTGFISPAERIKRIRQLGKDAKKLTPQQQFDACEDLTDALVKEKDPLARTAMLYTLAAFHTKRADEMLRAGLHDPETDVRVACCDAWARHGGPDAARLLAEMLSSEVDLDVRMAAARALGTLKDGRAIGPLGLALDDQNVALQYRAMQSLRQVTGHKYKTVQEWRAFAQGGKKEPETIVSRLRRLF
jgi:hypothetical protein